MCDISLLVDTLFINLQTLFVSSKEFEELP